MKCVETFWASSTTASPWPHASKASSNSNPKLLSNFQFTRSSKAAYHHCIAVNAAEREDEAGSLVKTYMALTSPHVKTITSTSNPFVKHCIKLRHSSSYRHTHGSVLVVGSTPIREIYNFQEETNARSTELECLIVLENADIPEELGHSTNVLRVSSTVMKKLSGVQSVDSMDMIALMRIPSTFHNISDHQQGLDHPSWSSCLHRVLVLDGIQDPGNLGTLLRSALAFRWDGAYLLPGCCDPFNDKALRASRGAAFQLPIVSGGWKYLEALVDEFHMKMLAGHPANDGKSVSLLSQGFAELLADTPLCLVLGNEGSGLSENARDACELLSIQMEGKFESLNVSVAGGIFLFMLQPVKHEFC